jgi:hypothetical protein
MTILRCAVFNFQEKGIRIMPILKSDIDELRRMAVNTYEDSDKKFLNRVMAGIAEMEREIKRLKADLDKANKAK